MLWPKCHPLTHKMPEGCGCLFDESEFIAIALYTTASTTSTGVLRQVQGKAKRPPSERNPRTNQIRNRGATKTSTIDFKLAFVS